MRTEAGTCVGAIDDLAASAADDEDRQPSSAEEYMTAPGEQREYVLQPDGTIAVGDPHTGQAWRTS